MRQILRTYEWREATRQRLHVAILSGFALDIARGMPSNLENRSEDPWTLFARHLVVSSTNYVTYL